MDFKLDPVFAGEEPEEVLKIFSELCRIPHSPTNYEPMSNFIADFCRDCGYEPIIDQDYNVIVRKPASPGKENEVPVMLQSHYDMVCQAEVGYEFDFDKDALTLIRDGDKIQAKGTTLGGDDGIDVAAVMAILADKNAVHPPLECVFTSNEEAGMRGAFGLDYSQFDSKMIINLDASPTKIGCFGSASIDINVPRAEAPVKDGCEYLKVSVGGLLGGHTGTRAMQEPGNAIVLLIRMLFEIDKIEKAQLCSIYGGPGGSFPKIGEAEIAVSPDKVSQIEELVKKLGEDFHIELEIQEPDVWSKVEKVARPAVALSYETAYKVKTLVRLILNGVFVRNLEFDNTATATGAASLMEERGEYIYIKYAVRSILSSMKNYLADTAAMICDMLGVKHDRVMDVPAWRTTINDDMKELLTEIYPERPPILCTGTMECGIFYERLPKDCQILALGVPFYLGHSPTEYILLSTTKIYYEKLREFISKVSWKHIGK